MRVAVNGFGRIGRLVTRILMTRCSDVEVVAINDPAPIDVQAYLFKHDSYFGRFPLPVAGLAGVGDRDRLMVGDTAIHVGHPRDPEQMRWGEPGTDLVIDSTGKLRKRADLEKHLAAGAGRVLVSAPASGADLTLVYGVNESCYDPAQHRVVSCASCTTNAAAALLETADREWSVEHAFVATVHAYTNSQALVDHSALGDPRDGRAAASNIVPSATGAASTLGQLFPHLRERIDGIAYRVPTATVSLLDLALLVGRPVGLEELADVLRRECARPERRGTLAATDVPLVSCDARGEDASAIVSLSDLRAQGRILRVVAWYDNEWGYSCRLADLARHMLLGHREATVDHIRSVNGALVR